MRDVISSTSKDLKNFTSLQNISRRLTQIPTSINLTKSEKVLLFYSNSNMNYTEKNQTHISIFKSKKYLTKHLGGKVKRLLPSLSKSKNCPIAFIHIPKAGGTGFDHLMTPLFRNKLHRRYIFLVQMCLHYFDIL